MEDLRRDWTQTLIFAVKYRIRETNCPYEKKRLRIKLDEHRSFFKKLREEDVKNAKNIK